MINRKSLEYESRTSVPRAATGFLLERRFENESDYLLKTIVKNIRKNRYTQEIQAGMNIWRWS